MKKSEIQVGKTYHNGKEGNRSYSSRQVLEISEKMRCPINGWTYPHGVKFKQIKGRYAGDIMAISFEAFAQWAKGEVRE